MCLHFPFSTVSLIFKLARFEHSHLTHYFSDCRRRLGNKCKRQFSGFEHLLQREASHRNWSLVDYYWHGPDYNATNYSCHSAAVWRARQSAVVHWARVECGHVCVALPTGSVAREKDRQIGRRQSSTECADNRMRLLRIDEAKESKFHLQSIFVQCRLFQRDWLRNYRSGNTDVVAG